MTRSQVGVAATTVPATTATQPVAADPGPLAQTDERPSASGHEFSAAVLGLWRAIVTDDPGYGRTFFFPQAAYRQVKDVGNPDGDYRDRLMTNYATDIHQLHDQLGPNARSATFIAFDVPDAGAEWIQPGAELNKGSYWRVYGSRIRYSVNGEQGSMAVTSLISWRGEWYVVHLGTIR